jgi:TRAP-type transport system periplasmic protein
LGGSLPIAGNNITQAVSENVVQLADDGFATGNIPITTVLRLPKLLLSVSDMPRAMAILRPYIDRDDARKGVLVLGQYTYLFHIILFVLLFLRMVFRQIALRLPDHMS